MNLPGLNFDVSKYPTGSTSTATFSIIPFSDWLPPDFEDVPCIVNGVYVSMYYSPASGMMVPADIKCGLSARDPKTLTTWLKALK